jgi:cytochrome c
VGIERRTRRLSSMAVPVLAPWVIGLGVCGSSWAAADAAQAEKLLKDSNCVKCHAVDRKKDGPAYRDVAAKFRTEPDPEDKVMHHITSGEMVKFPDGHEERHKKVKTDDVELRKNLVRWILSLEGGTKY